MNSLNILSSRVIGQAPSSSTRSRSHSQGDASPANLRNDLAKARSRSEQHFHYTLPKDGKEIDTRASPEEVGAAEVDQSWRELEDEMIAQAEHDPANAGPTLIAFALTR